MKHKKIAHTPQFLGREPPMVPLKPLYIVVGIIVALLVLSGIVTHFRFFYVG